MPIKKLATIFLVLSFGALSAASEDHATQHKRYLSLYHPKNDYWALSSAFLQHMIQLFGTTIFVETGTCGGNTTRNALTLFQEIHSIELSRYLYEKVSARLNNYSHLHLYCGDSAKILPSILPKMKGRILFWLDGHYSGGRTEKTDRNTPIVAELAAIAASGIHDAIILIDDIRCFQGVNAAPENSVFSGYPTCAELEQLILNINPEYQFVLFEDIALAYLPSDNIEVSPVIKACTFCRMAQEKKSDHTLVQQAAEIIASAQGNEKETLQIMNESLYGPAELRVGHHYRLWYGLTKKHEGNVDQLFPLVARGLPYYQ